MTEIFMRPVCLSAGETYTANDDTIAFTEEHSHRDILRYVIEDIGAETLIHVRELLGEKS